MKIYFQNDVKKNSLAWYTKKTQIVIYFWPPSIFDQKFTFSYNY